MRFIPASIFTSTALLIGFSAGDHQITPNYRWCVDTQRGTTCYSGLTECQAAAPADRCDPRLVAEPVQRRQPRAPKQ